MIRALLLSLCVLAAAAAAHATDLAATLVSVQGSSRCQLPDGQTVDLKAGSLLKAGTRIMTGEGARAVLLLTDGSRVSLGPNTEMTLTRLSEDAGARQTLFDLVKGLFHATVTKLTVGSAFQVRTVNGVAAVKGTDFEVQVDENGTVARVNEGKVWLDSVSGERAVIAAGLKACSCGSEHRISDVTKLTRQERRNFRQWRSESVSPHSGAYLPVDQAKRAAYAALRPDQKLKMANDLVNSLGDTWSDITGLTAEERQERWRDDLRANDERHLAGEATRVDFALGKCAIDRHGDRVRFDEFLVRPAADQLEFLNYTRRDNSTDVLASINTYNQALPLNLSQAPGLNQRLWLQAAAPQYWVTSSSVVAGNNLNDSFAATTDFYDPYHRLGLGYWELPVQQTEVRLNIPDLRAPTVGGTQVELWTRQYVNALDPNTTQAGAMSAMPGVAASSVAAVSLRSVPGSTNNLPAGTLDALGGPVNATIANTDLVWSQAVPPPTVTLNSPAEMGTQPGDLAFGFTKHYNNGMTLSMNNIVITENGDVVSLAGIPPDQLLNEFVKRGLIASLKEVEIGSNQFQAEGGIDVVSKLLFLFDVSKTQDQL